jgi:azurin
MTEALWLHQWHNVVDRELLGRMLESPEPRARAQATRVLCYWRDRVADVLALLARRAEDEHPRVRLEAVRAASFFRSSDAVDVALAAVKHPLDYYLQYTLGETLRQLEPQWREAIRGGKPIAAGNPAGFAHLIRSISTADLLQLPRTPEIAQALLSRGDVLDAERHKLLSALADQRGTSRAAALLGTLAAAGEPAAKANVARLLPQLTPRDLKPLREKLLVLAGEDQPPAVRRHALAAVVTADETFDRVWPSAADSQSVHVDVLAAVPLVYDPFIRARAYELIAPLVTAREAQRVSPEAQRAAIAALASINRHPDRTFSALADLIEHGQEIPTAVSGLRALPRTSYSAERADALAGALLKWAQAVPAEDRTSSDYLSTVQFAEGLVTMLPPQRAGEVLEQLRALRVARFAIRAVREQMRYDTPWIVVEAGKPFEIAFENPDMMPHNLVVVRPGARERIGKAAMTMKPTELDSAGRAYVPASEDILAATKMIDSGQSETLKLTAPTMEGEYSYVCTYPEHWQVMWGRLIITKDIETYLRTMPDAPVAADAAGHAHQHAPQTSN